jgi:3'-phosphoadenosine 5'-phosphosulfate sulfotransferase (PAPS reductase)/FAD synthetase
MRLLHHVGISGGKDSTALLLWAIHESGIPRESLRVTFCDTGNEDPLTYAHLDLLKRTVIEPAGIISGFVTLLPELDFFELALKKKRFPSRVAQFCTTELKIKPTKEWMAQQWALGHELVILNGKRLGESAERKRAMKDQPARGFSDYWGCEEWMPLRDWSLEDVFAIHRKYEVPLNPLYAMGAHRVGCWPCINCGKIEIRLVAKHRPEKIEAIAAVEKRFEDEQGRISTFFHGKTATKQYRTKSYTRKKDGTKWPVAPIHEIVKWAHTTRGGRQMILPLEESKACFLNYTACE